MNAGRMEYDESEGKDIRARVILAFLDFVKFKYPHVDTQKACWEVGIDPARVHKENEWLSFRESTSILDKLIEKTGDPALFYRAGQFTVSPQYLGKAITSMVGAFLSVTTIYQTLSSVITQFNRTIEIEVKKPKYWSAEVLISIRIRKDALESVNRDLLIDRFYDVIMNLIGSFRDIPTLKGMPEAVVNVLSRPTGKNKEKYEYQLQIRYFDVPQIFSPIVLVFLLVGAGIAVAFFPIRQWADQLPEIALWKFGTFVFFSISAWMFFVLFRTQRYLRSEEFLALLRNDTIKPPQGNDTLDGL